MEEGVKEGEGKSEQAGFYLVSWMKEDLGWRTSAEAPSNIVPASGDTLRPL